MAINSVNDNVGNVRVAISSCLLGESVRYNGGHKRSDFCAEELSKYFDLAPFCPEVAIGMGVPREAIRLVGDWNSPRAVGTKSPSLDVSESLLAYADAVKDEVLQCSGYIFMKDSPSCGLYSTKVYTEKGTHVKKRAGLFAGRIRDILPLLPMEEVGRLNDGVLRENFVTRVYLFHDWQTRVELQAKSLINFHSRHKYLIMAYSQKLYRCLGRMVASAGGNDLAALQASYIHELMVGTQKAPSKRGHVNVLYHMVGYLREMVPGGIRQDLTRAIDEYSSGQVPLSVPMKLMRHYLENYGSDYIKGQSYLSPHPFELGLRNSI